MCQMEEVGRAVACVKELEDYVAGLKSTHSTLENSLAEANDSIQSMTKTLQQSEVKYDTEVKILDCDTWIDAPSFGNSYCTTVS